VRLGRRRRPAGYPQVPEVVPPESRSGRVFLLRLGPGRLLLDLPVGTCEQSVASVWLEGEPPDWVRAPWPVDQTFLLPIAPLDLWPGHVIEFSTCAGEQPRASYACVIGVLDRALVGVLAVSAPEAISMSTQVHSGWSCAQVETALGCFQLPRAVPGHLE
jgi:hypothetical protein